MIAIAGWRTYLQELSGLALQIWSGQMALNFVWSPVVFRFPNLALGIAIIVTMLALFFCSGNATGQRQFCLYRTRCGSPSPPS